METLWERSRKNILVTAHGGYNAGIVTFNSLLGFEAALRAGADIIELDLTKSAEGKLYVFHPGTEKRILGHACDLRTMTNEQIEAEHHEESHLPIPSFDEVLEAMKGRCYINTDKAFTCFPELVETIRRHKMEDQIILKGEVKNQWIYDAVEELAPDISFLAVSYETDEALEMCKGRKINYVGSEVVFAKDDAPVADPSYIEMMHQNKKVLWVNPILFDFRRPLVGGHDDIHSLTVNLDDGWGWLADRGYDIFQTDWVTDCVTYLKNSRKFYR